MPSTLELNVPALQERVKRILTDPTREWPVIAAEQTSIEQLYRTYIGPLALIPAVAGFIGNVDCLENGNLLPDTIFEDREVGGLEPAHGTPVPIEHRDVEPDEID